MFISDRGVRSQSLFWRTGGYEERSLLQKDNFGAVGELVRQSDSGFNHRLSFGLIKACEDSRELQDALPL